MKLFVFSSKNLSATQRNEMTQKRKKPNKIRNKQHSCLIFDGHSRDGNPLNSVHSTIECVY